MVERTAQSANPSKGGKRKYNPDDKSEDYKKKQKKSSHDDQKNVRKERKSHDRNFDMISEAKKIWEQLRRSDIDNDEQKKLMEKITKVITGKVQEVIFKHDASRIIQTCLKKGNAEQRRTIVSELKGKFMELAKSMYGKFIVTKALEYCHWERNTILEEFRPHIRKLIRHREASTVIEAFYAEFANGAQKNDMLGGFYGPEMTLFNRGEGAQTLESFLESMPSKKEPVLKYMGEVLSGCTDKGTVVHSIVHKVLLQYLTLAESKDREQMVGHLLDNLQEIVHTREGSRVAMLCLSYSSPKDRKKIIKNFKPYLVKMAKDEYGYLVLLRLLDVTDDTVLLSKAVIDELLKHAKELFADKFGRRVFLYILAGRNTKYLLPDTVKILKDGDEIRTSKKDPEVRSQEILEACSPRLIQIVAENAAILMREKLSSQVVQEIMLHARGDKSAPINTILELVDENIEKENHVMVDRFANRIIKAMVKADSATNFNDKAVEPLNFANQLLDHVKDNIGFFATNFGSFVVLALAEEPSTKKKVLGMLKPHAKDIAKAAEDKNAGAKQLQAIIS